MSLFRALRKKNSKKFNYMNFYFTNMGMCGKILRNIDNMDQKIIAFEVRIFFLIVQMNFLNNFHPTSYQFHTCQILEVEEEFSICCMKLLDLPKNFGQHIF